jgi:uncharacterized protein (TIGR03437 family)
MKRLVLAAALASAAFAQNPRVRFATNLGNIDVELLQDGAPRTVQNFLTYMNRGDYNGTFFHRSVQNFVVQAGGFRWGGSGPVEIRQDAPIRNEYSITRSNIRGTIAMAKLGSGPDTATNQWFFNLADNSSNLNNQNGGFTVFGRIVDAAGLDVLNRIAGVRTFNLGSPFDAIPLQNYSGAGAVAATNLLVVNTISLIQAPNLPTISGGGIVTPAGFGASRVAAPGAFLEIYGTNLAGATRSWGTADFSGDAAPTSLDGVSVLVGGQPAFVNYISPGQVNVQVPAGVSPGRATVVVTNRGNSSTATEIEIRAVSPGLLAPPTFKAANGAQWVAALRPDGSFVSDGKIPGLPDTPAPARPGETLIFYGTGFGAVAPGPAAGRIVRDPNSVVAPVEIRFGDKAGRITYGGLAPGLVGLYQFNVVVPDDAPTGDAQLNVTVDGRPIEQSLYITMRQ